MLPSTSYTFSPHPTVYCPTLSPPCQAPEAQKMERMHTALKATELRCFTAEQRVIKLEVRAVGRQKLKVSPQHMLLPPPPHHRSSLLAPSPSPPPLVSSLLPLPAHRLPSSPPPTPFQGEIKQLRRNISVDQGTGKGGRGTSAPGVLPGAGTAFAKKHGITAAGPAAVKSPLAAKPAAAPAAAPALAPARAPASAPALAPARAPASAPALPSPQRAAQPTLAIPPFKGP